MIDENNFLLYAAKFYDVKRSSSTEEFLDDIKRFQYIKKLFKKYKETNEINSRLVLNHIVILYNCFGTITTKLLFYKLEGYHNFLIPFLYLLNQQKDQIEYNNKIIYLTDIDLDPGIINQLRNIKNAS